MASYINPGGNPADWNRLLGYPAYKISILVANVMNGPDSTVASSWTDVITRGIASGKTVLGYVLLNWQRFCEVVIELYYQEVWLVLDNIYMRICLAPTHVTDQGLPIQHSPQTLNQSEHS